MMELLLKLFAPLLTSRGRKGSIVSYRGLVLSGILFISWQLHTVNENIHSTQKDVRSIELRLAWAGIAQSDSALDGSHSQDKQSAPTAIDGSQSQLPRPGFALVTGPGTVTNKTATP